MKRKIDSYFSRVTANRHACNMYVGGETFDLKFQAEKEAKKNRQREIDYRVKERREAAKKMKPDERTAEQNVKDELDFIVDGLKSQCFFIFLFSIFTLSFYLSQRCNPLVFIYLFIFFIHTDSPLSIPHYIERTHLITMIYFYEKSS